MPRMIGRQYPDGPGGRDCRCCDQAPGKTRKATRRSVKRSERNTWKQNTRRGF